MPFQPDSRLGLLIAHWQGWLASLHCPQAAVSLWSWWAVYCSTGIWHLAIFFASEWLSLGQVRRPWCQCFQVTIQTSPGSTSLEPGPVTVSGTGTLPRLAWTWIYQQHRLCSQWGKMAKWLLLVFSIQLDLKLCCMWHSLYFWVPYTTLN